MAGSENEASQRLAMVFQDITERRRIEAALRQSEERLQLATEAAGLGIFDVNLVTLHMEWGVRQREIWGVGADEVITDDLFIAGVHPKDREFVRTAVARALDPDGNGLYAAEYRIVPLDGSGERWIVATGRVHFEERRPVRLVGTVQDITDRRRTEAALRRSEERLQLATEAAGLGIFDANLLTGEREWGTRLRDIWGVGADEVITHEIFMAGVHPMDREFVEAALEHAHSPDGTHLYAAEYRVLPLNGAGERWIVATGRMHFEGRQPVRLIGTMQDITERKRTEEALRRSEAEFRAIANAAPALVWVSTPTGEDIFVNERWCEYSGQTREEAGHGWRQVIHPEDWDCLAACWEHCQQTGEPYEGEARYRRRDGEYRWHLCRALPRRGPDGTIQAWYGVSIDVHDAKLGEERLRDSEEHFRQVVDAFSGCLDPQRRDTNAGICET